MNHTVLLVEDEEDLRESMRDALELYGYVVVAARDGQEALDELERIEHVCVVILDLLMPKMDGWEFFARLRAQAEFATVPVVVHSSAPSRAPAGVNRVLQKPMQLDRLIAVVRDFCQARA